MAENPEKNKKLEFALAKLAELDRQLDTIRAILESALTREIERPLKGHFDGHEIDFTKPRPWRDG